MKDLRNLVNTNIHSKNFQGSRGKRHISLGYCGMEKNITSFCFSHINLKRIPEGPSEMIVGSSVNEEFFVL
jgi:hypothetical protein